MLRVCGRLLRANNNTPKLCVPVANFHRIISDEVRNALLEDKAVVALESTIITHGMPYPENVKCALEVEAEVRSKGAVPATVAIIQGQIRVGLSENDIERLGRVTESHPIKTSRRDLAYVVSTGRNGGTTVSGTLIIANQTGIPVFATGGIGGVHRAGETTFDISADLTELGKSNVAVVSSGIKSILDIPKTLEYLETQGVFVATFGGGNDFPAFYSRKSGCQAPYSVTTALEAAKIISCSRNLNLQSGMLFAVPVPEEFALEEGVIDGVIHEALRDAKRKNIEGKQITPFLLGRIGEITAGKSLRTNIALIKNNARTAASIACELATLKLSKPTLNPGNKSSNVRKPVVVGGSNLDHSIKLDTDDIKLDGRIHFGKVTTVGGGVARNVCEALSKLECPPIFISVIGDDPGGRILQGFIPPENSHQIKVVKGRHTAQCTVVLDPNGECKFLAGDMEIHQCITPEMILDHEFEIKEAPLVVFDANLSLPTIEVLLKLAQDNNVPVLFEPTDVDVAAKPFQTQHSKAVKLITPNLNELRHIAAHFKLRTGKYDNKIDEVVDVSSQLVDYIDNIVVTLGVDGVVVARKGEAGDSFLCPKSNKLGVRHYPADKIKKVVSVSGAGDNFASGLVAGIINGLSEEECLSVALATAQTALRCARPVSNHLFGKNHPIWKKQASYISLI